MKRVFRISRKGKVKPIVLSTLSAPENLDAKLALIQALIPLGLLALAQELKREVIALAGERYSRTGGLPGIVRWSQQKGSVYLADQGASAADLMPSVRRRSPPPSASAPPASPGASSGPVPGSRKSSASVAWNPTTWWPSSWTGRPSPRMRWSSP